MKSRHYSQVILFIVVALAGAACLSMLKSKNVKEVSAAKLQTEKVIVKAQAFLDSLSLEQKRKVKFAFPKSQHVSTASFKGGMNGQMTFLGEKYGDAVWSNYPVSDVIRPGLRLESLSQIQQNLELELLRTSLSYDGYQKVLEIMGSDETLSKDETHFAAGRGKILLQSSVNLMRSIRG